MNESHSNSSDLHFINDYKSYIITLADKHHVVYQHTEMDTLAEQFTELSGDTVVQDDICDLLVALARQKIISIDEMVELQMGYLREKKLGQKRY
jgi:hypothetical protein